MLAVLSECVMGSKIIRLIHLVYNRFFEAEGVWLVLKHLPQIRDQNQTLFIFFSYF